MMYGKKISSWSREKTRHKFYQKVQQPICEKYNHWFRGSHNVIHSPNYKDTVLIGDTDSKLTPKNKLLLQYTTDEFLQDLYSNKYGLSDVVHDLKGKRLISKEMLGLLFPKELCLLAITANNFAAMNTVYQWISCKMP